jgi:hypothetical protein
MAAGEHGHARAETSPLLQVSFTCGECGADSGSSLVCRGCIPKLSVFKRTKYKRAWHLAIVTAANCSCVDCGHSAPFDSGELCGDHIATVGSRPDLQFDVTNGRCVCLADHNKRHSQGLPKPQDKGVKRPKFKRPAVCSHPRCPIYAAGAGFGKPGKCWRHQR